MCLKTQLRLHVLVLLLYIKFIVDLVIILYRVFR
ncbi:Thioredoxin domain-containing protein [Psidium guajava]|nr:Thioredoxin domain-containing protein [Psidium guajava]